MKFILNKDKLTIEDKESLNSGSFKYYEIEIEKDETWDDLSIEAVILKENEDIGIGRSVINNKVYIDRAFNGKYFIGFKGYTVEYALTEDVAINSSKTYYTRSGEEGAYVYTKVDSPSVESISTYYEATKTYQVSTKLTKVTFKKGAGEVEVENESEIPSISEWEVYVDQIQDMIEGLESLIPTKISDLINDNYTVTDEDYVHTDNNYTTTEKTKLAGLNNYDDTQVQQDITDLKLNKANKSEIPDVSGFYTKPSGGIPKTDLADAVQTSLGKADTAIQDISGKQNVIDSSHKLSADLISDGTTNKTVTATEKTTWSGKQDALVSGTNIKTINNESILGSGNIIIQGGGSDIDIQINGTSIVSSDVANIVTKTAYDSSTNKIATESDIPDISGKLDTSKVKTSTSTTSGDVYDVTYINTQIGNIETLLSAI